MKPIHPLFKVFGSKWMSAKHYPAPEHDFIFEPFAGSAGYSLNYHWYNVNIYETDLHLKYLWEWLINEATADQILRIPINLPEGTDIRELDLNYGQKLLLKHWQRTNNRGNCWTISKWGHLPGQWTENTRARVAEEVYAIKHWRFETPVYSRVGTWFIDPPYIYNYKYGCNLTAVDYENLAMAVNCLPAGSLAICCEAICPKTGRIPDYLPFQPSHRQVTSRRKQTNNHHSKELVYVHRT